MGQSHSCTSPFLHHNQVGNSNQPISRVFANTSEHVESHRWICHEDPPSVALGHGTQLSGRWKASLMLVGSLNLPSFTGPSWLVDACIPCALCLGCYGPIFDFWLGHLVLLMLWVTIWDSPVIWKFNLNRIQTSHSHESFVPPNKTRRWMMLCQQREEIIIL